MGSVYLLLPPLRLLLSPAWLLDFVLFRTALFVVVGVRALHFPKAPLLCFREKLAPTLIIRAMKKCILVSAEVIVGYMHARHLHYGQALQSAETPTIPFIVQVIGNFGIKGLWFPSLTLSAIPNKSGISIGSK